MIAAVPSDRSRTLPLLTPLVGRERESAEIQALLLQTGVPILTLTGPGGVGKTRLALYVAESLSNEFADGVTFVPLAQIRDPALVASAIAQALGVRDTGGGALDATLNAALRDKHLLLVLDNFEQVLDAAPFVAGLLGANPGVTVLATSRARLRLSVEREYPVPLLTLPATLWGAAAAHDPGPVALERLNQSEAVRLFVERSRAVSPAFALKAEAAAVAEICTAIRKVRRRNRSLPAPKSDSLRMAAACPRCKMVTFLGAAASGHVLTEGDAIALPFPDASFDAAVATQVYEYVHDVPAALAELHRVLRPGGRAVIVDTAWDSMVWHSSDPSRMTRILAAWDEHLADPYLPRTLRPQLQHAGFAVPRVEVLNILNLDWDGYSRGAAGLIAGFVAGRHGITQATTEAWLDDLSQRGAEGSYLFSLDQYLFLATKPEP